MRSPLSSALLQPLSFLSEGHLHTGQVSGQNLMDLQTRIFDDEGCTCVRIKWCSRGISCEQNNYSVLVSTLNKVRIWSSLCETKVQVPLPFHALLIAVKRRRSFT